MASASRSPKSFFIAGGTLPPHASSYVERGADHELFSAFAASEYCYVLNSRQMGKSSLCVKTIQRLTDAGVRAAFIDLTRIGVQNVSVEQWYVGLASEIGRGLGLRSEFLHYWQQNAQFSFVQRLFGGLREVALTKHEGDLVIFVDELDAVKSLQFSTDEFFAAIREAYVSRSSDSRLERLTFCLIGTATPADLVSDARITPFNVGRRIVLEDFSAKEAAPLAEGFSAGAESDRKQLLDRVLHWTGGHPFLTQRLCGFVSERGASSPTDVDAACSELYFTHTARESDDNLAFVRNRLLRSEADVAELLGLYRSIRRGKLVKDDETNPVVSLLKLSGLARVQDGALHVRNRIYERVFDDEWIDAHMPDAEVRRQRAAFRHGVMRTAAVGLTVLAIFLVLLVNSIRYSADASASAKFARAAEARERTAKEEAQRSAKLASDKSEEASKRAEEMKKLAAKLRAALDASEKDKKHIKALALKEKQQAVRETVLKTQLTSSNARIEELEKAVRNSGQAMLIASADSHIGGPGGGVQSVAMPAPPAPFDPDAQTRIQSISREIERARQASNHGAEVASLKRLGDEYAKVGDAADAEKAYSDALNTVVSFGPPSSRAGQMASLYDRLGTMQLWKGDHAAAMKHFSRAVQDVRVAKDWKMEGRYLTNLAVAQSLNGETKSAVNTADRAVRLMRQRSDKASFAEALKQVGAVQAAGSGVIKARASYREAIELTAKTDPDSLSIADLYMRLAATYTAPKDMGTARALYEKALAIQQRRAPGSIMAASTWLNIGKTYALQGNHDRAIESYQTALSSFQSIAPGTLGVAHALLGVGISYTSSHQADKAMPYLNQALDIARRMAPGSRDHFDALSAIASAEIDTRQYDAAQLHLNRAEDIAMRLGVSPLGIKVLRRYLETSRSL